MFVNARFIYKLINDFAHKHHADHVDMGILERFQVFLEQGISVLLFFDLQLQNFLNCSLDKVSFPI